MAWKKVTAAVGYDDGLDAAVPKELRLFGNPYAPLPFLLIEDFLPPEACALLYQKATAAVEGEAEVITGDGAAGKKDESHRKTFHHTLDAEGTALYREAFDRHREAIERFFSLALAGGSGPQLLGYGPGGFYSSHADNASKIVDANGTIVGWKAVAPERKITTLLFLGGEFTGGEVSFDYLFREGEEAPITLAPETGTMVVFPSNPYFAHTVHPVKSGYRLTLVEWHRAMGR